MNTKELNYTYNTCATHHKTLSWSIIDGVGRRYCDECEPELNLEKGK
jgi:hypothetical protein